MPSRKQRRRRAKERRHEYETVYVDDEGREVEVDPAELERRREPRRETAQKTVARSGAKPQARGTLRPVPAPSWRRVLRRAGIFAPFMLIAISLLGHKLSWAQRIEETIVLLILFVPFSYMLDRMM